MSSLLDLDAILQPIPGPNPAGVYLYSDPAYRQINQARTRNPEADWRFVVRFGQELLTQRSKDLQIAVHVMEALGRLHGVDGLRQGFELITALQDSFWPTLFPLPDGDDFDPRLGPFESLDYIVPPILDVLVPLTAAPSRENYNLQRFKLNHEALTHGEMELRDDTVRRTNPEFYVQLARDFESFRSAYDSWRKSLAQNLGKDPLAFQHLPKILAGLGDCLIHIEKLRPFRALQASAPRSQAAESADLGRADPAMEVANSTVAQEVAHTELLWTESLRSRKPLAVQAAELAEGGRLDAAIELLDQARQSARCRRERFIHQLEMVEVCLHHDKSKFARPLLDELFEELETRKIEEWEDPGLCARVLSARLACMKASGSHEDLHQIPLMFQRLCRLDPRRALGQQEPLA